MYKGALCERSSYQFPKPANLAPAHLLLLHSSVFSFTYTFPVQLLPEYQSQAKKLEEKVDTFKRLTDMEEKVKWLEMELQWAMVAELERVR